MPCSIRQRNSQSDPKSYASKEPLSFSHSLFPATLSSFAGRPRCFCMECAVIGLSSTAAGHMLLFHVQVATSLYGYLQGPCCTLMFTRWPTPASCSWRCCWTVTRRRDATAGSPPQPPSLTTVCGVAAAISVAGLVVQLAISSRRPCQCLGQILDFVLLSTDSSTSTKFSNTGSPRCFESIRRLPFRVRHSPARHRASYAPVPTCRSGAGFRERGARRE